MSSRTRHRPWFGARGERREPLFCFVPRAHFVSGLTSQRISEEEAAQEYLLYGTAVIHIARTLSWAELERSPWGRACDADPVEDLRRALVQLEAAVDWRGWEER